MQSNALYTWLVLKTIILYNFIINLKSNSKFFATEKRPDSTNNRRPTLVSIQNRRPNSRYRQGYHYQPVTSTSQLSPTFVFGKTTYFKAIIKSIDRIWYNSNVCFCFSDPVPGPSSPSNCNPSA